MRKASRTDLENYVNMGLSRCLEGKNHLMEEYTWNEARTHNP